MANAKKKADADEGGSISQVRQQTIRLSKTIGKITAPIVLAPPAPISGCIASYTKQSSTIGPATASMVSFRSAT